MNKSIKRIFYLFFVLFFVMILYILKFSLMDSKNLLSSTNPRLNIIDKKIIRGEIKDIKGMTLVQTILKEDKNVREYCYGKEFAHVLGYLDMGKYGVEAYANFELQRLHFETWQRVNQMLTGSSLQGNHVVTTLDFDIQKEAYTLLGKKKGSIIVMEPTTGKVLAMVSNPSFNPNTIYENQDSLNSDKNSPLVNRATQGLYPPGSVFKIITLACAIENLDDWATFEFECTGKTVFGNNVLKCSGGAHGIVNYKKAMAVSCNGYFASIGEKLGGDRLRNTAMDFYFNKGLKFPLEYNITSFALNEDSDKSSLLETSIGQGKTLTSPLHLAMTVCAVANGGVMMKPYIIDHIEYADGNAGDKTIPQMMGYCVDIKTANVIKDTMIEVVETGTAKSAKIEGVLVAGKTGTAQNPEGADHAWFVSFAPADNPSVCVAVVLENGGNGSSACPIAKKLMEIVIKKNK